MAKFTKSELKRSLLQGLSLLEKDDDFVWATYDEIDHYYRKGFVLTNDKKRGLYEGKKKGMKDD
jgi:hypothetical protein